METYTEKDTKSEGVVAVEPEFEVATAQPVPTTFLGRLRKKLMLKSADDSRRSNEDLDPVTPDRRTWRAYNYIMYWISDCYSAGSWRNGSSLMEAGLSWRLALLNIAIAYILMAAIITINGVVGSRYHVAFTVQSRSAFGYYLSHVMVAMRMIVGVFWYGTNNYTGAECVRSMLYAIWPSFRNVPNHLPASANITTQLLASYVIYWILTVPVHLVPMHKLRWFFTFKSLFTPIAGFAIMGWVINKVGVGKDSALFSGGNAYTGSTLGWSFMSCLYASMGSYATLACNINDFTRYAKSERNTYVQAFIIPALFTFVTFMGLVGASGSKALYGTISWDPLVLIDHWTSKGGRAAAFFCALTFFIAQIGVNISANSISAANDLNCLFPRYINIRRGQMIVAVIGAWALTPWNILSSAAGFLSFMSGYTIWLGPMCGILVSDFYFVHHQKLDVYQLYDKEGIYRFNKYGINWRALVAFFVGFVPLLPGFIHSINANIEVNEGIIHLYNLGYFWGFGSAAVVHVALNRFWPHAESQIPEAVYPDDSAYYETAESSSVEVVGEKKSMFKRFV
ncbi:permease for cytosine/purines, uracil, thiamine, allantoin-domain-containing protein [Dipodascopsis tothii]|uniref:permease for cytosine/purines, uracil, thiamine, allantoin-domain-containing protein n=1 Tax=Dipodascopsis tothii TaxID=44089 RepID=UPI0034CDFDF6